MNRIPALLQMLESSPQDSFLLFALAQEYAQSGDVQSAMECYETILDNDPDYIGLYYHYGLLLYENRNTELALDVLEKGADKAASLGDRHALSEIMELMGSMDAE